MYAPQKDGPHKSGLRSAKNFSLSQLTTMKILVLKGSKLGAPFVMC